MLAIHARPYRGLTLLALPLVLAWAGACQSTTAQPPAPATPTQTSGRQPCGNDARHCGHPGDAIRCTSVAIGQPGRGSVTRRASRGRGVSLRVCEPCRHRSRGRKWR